MFWYRNEGYSEPQCSISENLAAKMLENGENGSINLLMMLYFGQSTLIILKSVFRKILWSIGYSTSSTVVFSLFSFVCLYFVLFFCFVFCCVCVCVVVVVFNLFLSGKCRYAKEMH